MAVRPLFQSRTRRRTPALAEAKAGSEPGHLTTDASTAMPERLKPCRETRVQALCRPARSRPGIRYRESAYATSTGRPSEAIQPSCAIRWHELDGPG